MKTYNHKCALRDMQKDIKDYLFNEYHKDGYDKRIEKTDRFANEDFVIFKKI